MLTSRLRVTLLFSCAVVAVTPALSDADGFGKWRQVSVASAFSGTGEPALGLISEGRKALLEVRCGQFASELRIRWVYYLGESPSPVTIQLGRGAEHTTDWPLSADHHDTLFPGDASEFIGRLRTVDTLTVRVAPYSMTQRRPISFELRHILMDDPPSSDEPKVLAPAPPKALAPATEVFDLRGLGEVPPSLAAGCTIP